MEEKETVVDASAVAAAKAKEAQEAVEHARAVQAEEFENRHLERMEQALRRIFPENHDDDNEMRIYLPRVPLLCSKVEAMGKSLEKIEGNISWVVKLIIAGFIAALAALIFK